MLKGELFRAKKPNRNSHELKNNLPINSSYSEETIPKKFQMPTMRASDGTSNPKDYVINYKTFMEL